MEDKEWDELKLIQEKLHEALDKGYPPIGKGGLNNPTGAKFTNEISFKLLVGFLLSLVSAIASSIALF